MVAANDVKEGDILLELDDIHMSFGKVEALAGISLKVKKGDIHFQIFENRDGLDFPRENFICEKYIGSEAEFEDKEIFLLFFNSYYCF